MDKSDIKSVSVIVGNCLACDGMVRIPASAKASSTVRCPHCAQSFPLQQILDRSVPELEILADIGNSREGVIPHVDRVLSKDKIQEKPREKFVVPRQLTLGAKRKRRHRRRDGSSSKSHENGSSRENRETGLTREQTIPASLQIVEDAPDSGQEFNGIQTSQSEVQSPIVKSRESRAVRRPGGSSSRGSGSKSGRRSTSTQSTPFFEVFKVVIGGALAFPIAYLMLFWIFKQDPLNFGPTVGKIVPFAVPVELRELEKEEVPKIETRAEKSLDQELNKVSPLPIPDVDPDKIGIGDIESLPD